MNKMTKTKRMQIGLDGWNTLHFQCGMTEANRNVLIGSHPSFLQERSWGIVFDMSMGADVMKQLMTLSPKWRSLNDPQNGKLNYVEVESISLPEWDGEEAKELSEEQAEGCITLVDKNGDILKLYLQPSNRLEALAAMVLVAYPEVMA
tara:strand:- start:387 stop:830 length:444 start_codon:yes stop_codon:yes gene_type:complete